MRLIDLRSDTVTRPSAGMREAMAKAEVGDDVYGEDPTVNRLQEVAAELLGFESALFVPSGTMANQLAIRASSSHGDVVLAGENAHLLLFESGGSAAISGVQIRTLGRGGFFDTGDIERALPPRDPHYSPVSVVALENTHNMSGGRVWPSERLARVARHARARGLALHLDGARVFNAAAAQGCEPREIAQHFDTLSFCLSKGLGAPVGSLVCSNRETGAKLLRLRKMFGGGMRQAGILAAAGLFALENHLPSLAEDHANAGRLARALDALGFEIPAEPETNILFFRVPAEIEPKGAAAFSARLRSEGVLINAIDADHLRAVTHRDVRGEDIDGLVERVSRLC